MGHATASTSKVNQPPAPADLRRDNFQREVDGKPVDLYTIENKRGMVVKLTNLGAKIQQILAPDRDGRLGDVALGYDTLDGVMQGQPSLNAFIGRYAHRIAGGRFTLDGVEHRLAINDSTRPKAISSSTSEAWAGAASLTTR